MSTSKRKSRTFLASKTINPHLVSQPGGDFSAKQRLTYKNKNLKLYLNQLIYVLIQILFVPNKFGPALALLPPR